MILLELGNFLGVHYSSSSRDEACEMLNDILKFLR